jgi:AcrR family transcriptional regulator
MLSEHLCSEFPNYASFPSVDSCAPKRAPSVPTGARELRKQRTRRALLDGALDLLEDRGFESLSLRQVTREAGVVPTAFYRHFPHMDALGVELVQESIGSLRQMIRSARAENLGYGEVINRSVQILVRHVHEHRAHFQFIARERFSGVAAIRQTIREQFALFVSELAADLRNFPVMADWSPEDRQLLAEIIVNNMIATAETILESPVEGEQPAVRRAEKQLRMIVVGLRDWRPAAPDSPPSTEADD